MSDGTSGDLPVVGVYGEVKYFGGPEQFCAEAQAMAVSPAIMAILASAFRMAIMFVMPANKEGLKARLTIICQNLTLIGVPAAIADYVSTLVTNDAVINMLWNIIQQMNVTPLSSQDITGPKLAALMSQVKAT